MFVVIFDVYLCTPLCLHVSLLMRPFELKQLEERASVCVYTHMGCAHVLLMHHYSSFLLCDGTRKNEA